MKRAFTLIEILVVVAIIALLIAVLLPALSEARDQARSSKCMANMKDMMVGVNTFSNMHRNRFQLVTGGAAWPNLAFSGPLADPDKSIYAYESGTKPSLLLVWPAVLLREGGNVSVKRNADWGIRGRLNAVANINKIRKEGILNCPSDKILYGTPLWPEGNTTGQGPYFGYLSYGINEDVTGDSTDANQKDPPVWKEGSKGLTPGAGPRLRGMLDRVKTPADVAMFSDMGSDKRLDEQTGNGGTEHLLISGGTRQPHGPLIEHCEAAYDRLPAERHRRGSLNVAFVDGHASFARRSKNPLYVTGGIQPQYIYLPKIRISPYLTGTYPVP